MRNLETFRNFYSNPFSLLSDVERDMRHLLDSTTYMEPGGRPGRRGYIPSCDIQEKDGHYLLSFDVPGVSKEDIKIDVQDGNIRVSGERKVERSENGYFEKSYGHFERVMSLPQGVNEDSIEAHYENGVLTVALRKSDKALPKQITISDSKKGGFWNGLLGSKKTDSGDAPKIDSSKASTT